MKKTALSFLLAIFCMIAIAQPGNNGTPQIPRGAVQPTTHWQPKGHQFTSNANISLMIFSPTNERFWLYINDMLYTRQSVHATQVNLAPNIIYNVKVMIDNRSREIVSESICLGGNGDAIMLTLERTQGQGYVNGYYRLHWNGQRIVAGAGNYAYIWMYKNDPYNLRYACGMDFYPIVPPTPQPFPQPNVPGNPNSPQPVYPNTQPVPPAPMPCPAHDFQNIKNIVRSQTFDKDRMNVALQALRGKNLTADQIAELAELFMFESDRLSFLKSAYNDCFDKQNYYVVYRVLTFSSSKDELTRFIQTH